MKKLLVLFVKGFPYNFSEPFLENEYPLYREYFDKVLMVTGCEKKEKPTRVVKDPTIEIITDHTLAKDIKFIIEALPAVLVDRMLYKELMALMKSGFSIRKLYDLLVVSFCGNHRAIQALKWIKQHPDYEVKAVYAYWLQIPAYAAVRVKQMTHKNLFTISRTHRFDLYSEIKGTGYLPFHKQMYDALDEVASISDDGKKYLESKYGRDTKVSIHHLGAVDKGIHNPEKERTPFCIVSCSRVIPVKRVHKIVDALAKLKDTPVCWTHIGGGAGLKELEEYAAKRLPSNITVTFYGTVTNTEVYEIYSEKPFHVFVNVSESEGVPVSIMEAMSFDVPIVATAVGGTPELIEEGQTGYLLSKDFSDDELADVLQTFIEMTNDEYRSFRKAVRAKFERDYNAIPNYRRFVEALTDGGKKKNEEDCYANNTCSG